MARFTIGDFSRITGLSVKTLRFYHEKGIVVPSDVTVSGYRYYDEACVEKARIVVQLRALDFSLSEIGNILESSEDDADILEHLSRRRDAVQEKIRGLRGIEISLNQIIKSEQEAKRAMENTGFEVEEKQLDPLLIAGVRMQGKYSDCGNGFSQIGNKLGRFIAGKPFCLYYDSEYKEDDADFEACMPVKRKKEVDGISVRDLPGGRCFSLLHKGPYDDLGRSYARVLAHVRDLGFEVLLPTREVYIKGPGMIFKGNPKRYLTEIQIPVAQ